MLHRVGFTLFISSLSFSEHFCRNIAWLYKEVQRVVLTGRQTLFVFIGYKLNGAKFTWHSIFNNRKALLVSVSICKLFGKAYTIWHRRRKTISRFQSTAIHSLISLTTCPQLLPKRVTHIFRPCASSFNFQYPIFSLRSSNSCLRLFTHLSITSTFPLILFPIALFRRPFLLLTVCRAFYSILTHLVNTCSY